jgi:ribulose-5-phosphate 4-epimerase/fuculose-1-phosphate aldolase
MKDRAMNVQTTAATRHPGISEEEWRLRVDLAGAYRIYDHLGWSEVIMNHLTVRVPGPEHHFLINPYGLTYDEITASNLVKIDLKGNVIGHSDWPINPAGFVIHSAIHAGRADAICVMHTHTTEAQAVAMKQNGLRHDSIYASQLYERTGYHDFEGLSLYEGEKERILASLGTSNVLLVMRNHGVLTIGRSIGEAFWNMWRFQRSAEVQIRAEAMNGPDTVLSDEVRRRCRSDADTFGPNSVSETIFRALLRKVHRIDPSYER